MNSSKAENFIRSAKAPAIRAGVMMANVIWNITNTHSGIVAARLLTLAMFMPLRNMPSNPPIYLFRLASWFVVKAAV